MRKLADFRELIPLLRPRSTIVLHSGCAEPPTLVEQLTAHSGALQAVHLYTMMPMGSALYATAAPESLSISTFFPGKGLRDAATAGRAQVLRTSLSGIPQLFRDGKVKADMLLLQLSLPDASGRMSLGISVDYMPAVLAQKPIVVAEINPAMPRTLGDCFVGEDQVDYFLPSRGMPQAVPSIVADAVDRQIAEHVAELIPNGAVIQTGIGSLPELVLDKLASLRDLGIHTGIITDALVRLLDKGAVTNATKKRFPGKCVTTMAAGTLDFYRALNENPTIEFHPCSVTHDIATIAANDGFCAINSVLQIDLCGRANAERVGGKIIAAPGGLPDFARGATLAKGGKSIIALRATSNGGSRSNILAELAPDAPIALTAEGIDFVVTEFGAARLRGLDPARRAAALIAIAHPDFRAELKQHAMR